MSSLPVTSVKKTQARPFLAAEHQTSLIQRSMRVADILLILPEAESVFAQYGLHCNGCSIGGAEILEDAASMHSMKEEDLNDLLADLHVLLARRPVRPQTITVTPEAAVALKNILEAEGKLGWVLEVGLDEAGGFNLEIVEKAKADDHIFKQEDVTVSASSVTLATIGGSTIDYREGRFTLDVMGQSSSGCCKDGRACACENGGTCDCEKDGGCGCH